MRISIQVAVATVTTVSIACFFWGISARQTKRKQLAITRIEHHGAILRSGTCGAETARAYVTRENWLRKRSNTFEKQHETLFLSKADFSIDLEYNSSHNLIFLSFPSDPNPVIAQELHQFNDSAFHLTLDSAGEETTSCLGRLKGVQYLNLQNAKIDDYSFIRQLTGLKSLNLKGANIRKLEPISNLESLEHLNLQNLEGKVDATTLQDLKSLKSLRLDGSEVVNFQSIAKLKQLESLSLGTRSEEFIDITPLLRELKSLRYLAISRAKVLNSKTMETFKQHKTLELFDCEIGQPDKTKVPGTEQNKGARDRFGN